MPSVAYWPRLANCGVSSKALVIIILSASSGMRAIAQQDGEIKTANSDRRDSVTYLQSLEINEDSPDNFYKLVKAGDVEYGKTLETSLLVQNTSERTLEFLEHSASCGCTTVDIPQKVIKPGESSVVRISFPLQGKSATAMAQQVLIKCRGPISSLITVIQVEPKNMVIFTNREYTFVVPIDISDKNSKFDVSLSATDTNFLNSIKFESKENPAIQSIRGIVRDGKAIAEVTLDNSKLESANLAGTLELTSTALGYKDLATFRIIKRSGVEVHPETIVIRPDGSAKNRNIGRALIKLDLNVRKTTEKGLSITRVSPVKNTDLPGVSVDYNRIKETLGQIKVTFEAGELLPSKVTPCELIVWLSDGSSVNVPVLLQFP